MIGIAVVLLLPRKSTVLELDRSAEHIRVTWVNVKVSWVTSKDNDFLNFINDGAFPDRRRPKAPLALRRTPCLGRLNSRCRDLEK